jgi:hypothetical protein
MMATAILDVKSFASSPMSSLRGRVDLEGGEALRLRRGRREDDRGAVAQDRQRRLHCEERARQVAGSASKVWPCIGQGGYLRRR